MNFERLWHWQRMEPNLGDNLKAPPAQRLYLEVAVGLTKVELQKVLDTIDHLDTRTVAPIRLGDESGKIDEAATEAAQKAQLERTADQLAGEWGPYVRLGEGAHAINGQPMTALRDYLRFVVEQPGAFNVFEIFDALGRLNSIRGSRELFYGPRSGGSTSTPRPNAAPAGSQTGGR